METTLTLRIYKNEIDAMRLAFIRRTFSIYKETEKVLTVEGSKDDILKLYDNYLLSDAQFKEAYPDFMTYAEISQATERANNFIKEREEEKNRAEEASERAREEVIKKYGAIFDQPSGKYSTDAVLVAKHIRKELSNEFPGQKFSVRKTDYSTIWIKWQDGPTRDEVEQIAGKHQRNCTRDRWNDDLWDYSDTAFTSVFGGVNYLYFNRETAPENREISLYTKPEPKQNKPDTIEAKGVQIIDYSEKAIAVVGDTRAIKDTLKTLGGRFNSHLTCGAGWIFSKTKEATLREALNI